LKGEFVKRTAAPHRDDPRLLEVLWASDLRTCMKSLLSLDLWY
jgi:hypothetical protein